MYDRCSYSMFSPASTLHWNVNSYEQTSSVTDFEVFGTLFPCVRTRYTDSVNSSYSQDYVRYVTAVCMCPMDLGTRPKLCTLSFSDYDSCDKQHKYHRPCQPRTAICSDTMDYVFTVYLILERPFSRCIPLLTGLLAAPLFLSYSAKPCAPLRSYSLCIGLNTLT